ncbi:phosphoglucosamine mutase [Halobellus sp. GM3]|uniref:phosphoglucosamine mutase n=1 Tax=Halobellus sp. GM3 TaxID=3458410 RepID=UPI00403DD04C
MFGTSGIRGPVGSAVTAEVALSVGRALASTGAETVIVGRDARESGRMLRRALVAGVTECGSDVVDVGVEPTPTISRYVGAVGADAGVAITASHNPPEDNGIKLWSPSGQAFDEARTAAIVEAIDAEAFDLADWESVGARTAADDARERHASALKASLSAAGAGSTPASDSSIADLSVVVDLGNGTGRVTADVLDGVGCDVETLNGQRDGGFPGRPSEPTAANCQTACALVGATDADLGIAHDGDADRMLAIDERGRFVSGDALLALFARREAGPGDRVAVPVDTSLAVADALAGRDAEVVYTRVGDVFVAERAAEPDVVFGGEPSGAWIWPDQTLCPDGPLAACTLASLVASEGPLSALVDDLPSYPIRRESVRTDEKAAAMDRVRELAAAEYASSTTLDGVRIDTDEGWFLVRSSGTEPLVRITAEARAEADAESLFEAARSLVDRGIDAANG